MAVLRKRPPLKIRHQVMQRARELCEYCYSQQRYCPSPFACDHIVPVSLGGATSLTNLALACNGCNGKKGNKVSAPDPLTAIVVPLYHPRHDRWDEHFRWSNDFQRLVGTSATGRATVEQLALNRSNVVNLRRLLITFKEHPPAPILD